MCCNNMNQFRWDQIFKILHQHGTVMNKTCFPTKTIDCLFWFCHFNSTPDGCSASCYCLRCLHHYSSASRHCLLWRRRAPVKRKIRLEILTFWRIEWEPTSVWFADRNDSTDICTFAKYTRNQNHWPSKPDFRGETTRRYWCIHCWPYAIEQL